jgi:aldose 1-epimerase
METKAQSTQHEARRRRKRVSALTALILAGAGLELALSQPASAAEAVRAPFGSTSEGQPVEIVTLKNDHGMSVRLISLGASVQAILTPDRRGRPGDVVLGYDSLKGYLSEPNYFGATVGRYANRIARGRFTLDGKAYELPINNGPNSLHGGAKGFDKVVWTVLEVTSGPTAAVTFQYVSPDGDQGYPGKLTATATYALNERNELSLEYRAVTDRPTIVNLSNHTYFNLAGEGAPQGALAERLMIPAQAYTPTDATSIPTGEIRPVAGTPFDFRVAKPSDGPRSKIPSRDARSRSCRTSRDCRCIRATSWTGPWSGSRGISTAGGTLSCSSRSSSPTPPIIPSSDRRGSIRARPTAI